MASPRDRLGDHDLARAGLRDRLYAEARRRGKSGGGFVEELLEL